jgi:proline iminopeptidase
LLSAYYQRLTNPDPSIHMPAARAWGAYEGACSTLLPNVATQNHFASDGVALSLARIEAHYFMNHIFLPDNALLNRIDQIRHLPCFIVQGRYDAVCPAISSYELHQAWPSAQYCIVADAGHAAFEPGIRSELVKATEAMHLRLRPV